MIALLSPHDGSKLIKQDNILSYRPTYNIVTASCDGICFVLGATMGERNNLVFTGMAVNAVKQFGDKKRSNEWSDGIWYGENGFCSLTHPNKAGWKKDKTGWWYGVKDGWYAKSDAYIIDGRFYQFNGFGYCTNP